MRPLPASSNAEPTRGTHRRIYDLRLLLLLHHEHLFCTTSALTTTSGSILTSSMRFTLNVKGRTFRLYYRGAASCSAPSGRMRNYPFSGHGKLNFQSKNRAHNERVGSQDAGRTARRGETGQKKVPIFRSPWKPTAPLALQHTVNNCSERIFASTNQINPILDR